MCRLQCFRQLPELLLVVPGYKLRRLVGVESLDVFRFDFLVYGCEPDSRGTFNLLGINGRFSIIVGAWEQRVCQ